MPQEVLWRPNPGPQTAFLASSANEVLYGGAAGGGKSAALMALPLRWVCYSRYRGLYLRREAKYLGDAIDKTRALYPQLGATLTLSPKVVWTFPSGATLWMNHCEHESDVANYDSFEFSEVLFDELTHFTEKQYRGIRARLRGTDPTLPYWSRAASNPGNAGHEWVFKRFAAWLDPKHERPARPVEKRWYLRDKEVPQGTDLALSRQFIPAKLEDNPHVAKGYEAQLLDLDAVRRAQLRDGDWLVKPAAGLLFKREWVREWLDEPLRVATHRVRYWDLAAGGDWAVGARLARGVDSREVVEHVARIKGTPAQVRALVIATAQRDGQQVPLFLEQDPGQAGKDQGYTYQREPELRGFTVRPRPKRTDKVTAFGPFSARQEAGAVCWVRGAWNEPVLEVLESFPDGDHDDDADALSGAFAALPYCRVQVAAPIQQPTTTRAHEQDPDPWHDSDDE